MTVPFKPEVATWLADWIGRTQADATRVAPQTPQLPPVPVLTADNTRPGDREGLRQAYDNPRVKLGQALQAAQVGAEFLPSPFGDVASAGAAVREARAGNPGLAALSAASALPFVTPIMVKGAKEARKSAKLIGKDANEDVLNIAEAMIRNDPMPRVTQVDAEKAARMAKVYEGLPKFDPEAKAAYDLLNEEVAAQAKAIQDAGYKFEFVETDPYANSAEMMKDVRENRRLKVFKTPGDNFHPYMTPEQNDTFRAVHDWIAHAGPGNQFGPIGEENAYRMHAATLSPQAQRALASETRGQNSWVNFGPHGHLPMKERPFAEQKAALWPEEYLGDYDKMPAPPGPSDLGPDGKYIMAQSDAAAQRNDPIVAAAVRSPASGKTYQGIVHADAIDQIREAEGKAVADAVQKSDSWHDLFVTKSGATINRRELSREWGDRRPIAEMMKLGGPQIEAPQLKVGSEKPALDESNLKLVPDYVTDPMERAPLYRAPRAELSQLTPMWKRVKDVFAKNADQGLKEGLGKWYDVTPLRKAFMDESETGQDDFELLMKLLGPTSSGTTTPSNVKQGSLMYFLSGDPVKFLDDLRSGQLDLPQGYANRRQSSVNRGVRRILEEGNLNPFEQPKTFRYGNIPTGRYFHSVPLDMHVGRQTGRKGNLVGEDGSLTPGRGFPAPSYAKDKKVTTSPSKTSYAPIEDHILAEAEKRGVPGAPFMAAGWEKGGMPDAIGGSTGVADIRGLIPLFNERIALTAKQRGVSQAEALRGFILKKWPLAAIGGATVGRGLLADSAHSDDSM